MVHGGIFQSMIDEARRNAPARAQYAPAPIDDDESAIGQDGARLYRGDSATPVLRWSRGQATPTRPLPALAASTGSMLARPSSAEVDIARSMLALSVSKIPSNATAIEDSELRTEIDDDDDPTDPGFEVNDATSRDPRLRSLLADVPLEMFGGTANVPPPAPIPTMAAADHAYMQALDAIAQRRMQDARQIVDTALQSHPNHPKLQRLAVELSGPFGRAPGSARSPFASILADDRTHQ